MNYSLLYATAKAAEKACKNIEFAEVGAGAAIKTMGLIPEDMRAVIEDFYITKPHAR
jgi:hypothetical protein